MKAYAFWQRGKGPVGRQIARLSRALPGPLDEVPSHMGLVFSPFGAAPAEVFEAHAKTGGWHQMTLDELQVEGADDRFWHFEIPIPEDLAWVAWERAQAAVGLHDYDYRGLLKLYLHRRLRFPVRPDPAKWFCSEGACRILAPVYDWRDVAFAAGFKHVGTNWDHLTPAICAASVAKDLMDGLPDLTASGFWP